MLAVALPSLSSLASAVVHASPSGPGGGDLLIRPDSTHHNAPRHLVTAGITRGCGPDVLCPADPDRRDQMASFPIRALDR